MLVACRIRLYFSTCALTWFWTSSTKAWANAVVTAWASSGEDPVPVIVRAPDVASTVPVTWPPRSEGWAFLRDLAAAICTAELESSWTGSDRVKPEPDEAAWLGAVIWMSALDW